MPEREGRRSPGKFYIVSFWMSGSSPRWSVEGAGENFGGQGDSRQDAIDGCLAKLEELARERWDGVDA